MSTGEGVSDELRKEVKEANEQSERNLEIKSGTSTGSTATDKQEDAK